MSQAMAKRAAAAVLAMACFAETAKAEVAATGKKLFVPPVIQQPAFKDATYEVKDFGAKGDGTTNDTAAVSAAIAKASEAGGGTVHFPAGKYMVASARIRSNVKLLLDKDAVIEGLKYGYEAPEPNEFDQYQDFGHSHFKNSVLWGENVENFAIVGGKVNGGGAITGDPKRPATQPDGSQAWGGDKVITIKVGKNLLFQDVTHDTGGHFVYLLNDCENVTLNKVVMKKSRDAVDFMGCRNVAVSECNFTGCSDDTIGIKSDYALGRRIKSENIYVWNCYFESGCNGLQFGSETAGDFKNIQCWDITINLGMKSGIGITSNDSGVIEDVHYKDIRISKAAVPIFIVVTDRLRTGEPGVKVGKIRNVTFENITITDVVAGRHHGPANAATISGRPDSYVENVTFENVKITYKGGDRAEEASVEPPYPKEKYQPNGMGPRPASGWYIRHAKGLTFRNCEVAYEQPTNKPPLVLFDVAGVVFDGFKVDKGNANEAMRLTKVTGVEVKNSPALKEATVGGVK